MILKITEDFFFSQKIESLRDCRFFYVLFGKLLIDEFITYLDNCQLFNLREKKNKNGTASQNIHICYLYDKSPIEILNYLHVMTLLIGLLVKFKYLYTDSEIHTCIANICASQ